LGVFGTVSGLVTELRRRRVIGVALAYVVVGAGVLGVVDATFDSLQLPSWTQTLVIVLVLLGFPLAMVLAWAYDVTPDGVVRTPNETPEPNRSETVDGGETTPARSPKSEPAETDEAWGRVQQHLARVLDLQSESSRRRYVSELAGEDPEGAAELERLLDAHESTGPLDDILDWLHQAGKRTELEPGARVAQYELVRRLGGGGMGMVFQAIDQKLDRTVALKFLSPNIAANREAKERFLVEARAAAGLDDVNICTVLEIGETPTGQLFLAMPFYDGETLQARIERGPLPVEEAVELTRQIASGLGSAHRRGIIHRDVKPANVIIANDGVVKLVDFGIAKVSDVALTRTGTAVGTISYMSPEQARGEPVDHRTDLWSLGVVLFEMLTGTRPFIGLEEQAVRTAILSAEPPAIESSRPDVPSALGSIVERALAKDPGDRYASAADFVSDLDAVDIGASGPVPDRGTVLPGGERRICTVLVALIPEYETLLEELAPEELSSTATRIEAAAAEAVSAEGGTILGSARGRLEAAFGVPMTHEDDGHRALRAASEIRARIQEIGRDLEHESGRSLSIRIGVDTGRVVARRNDDGRPGHECRRLVATAFETTPTEELDISGFDKPLATHTVLGEGPNLTTIAARAEQGLTQFHGREEELAVLGKAAQGAATGEGGFVSVVGEPGVGKSRLLYEFSRRLDPQRFRLLIGRCAQGGRGGSYAPIVEVLRDAIASEGADRERIDAELVVESALRIGDDLAHSLPLLLQVLSLHHPEYPFPRHLQGDQLRVAVVEAIAGFLSVLASHRPLVVLLEDWHWADEASMAALLQIAEVATSFPLMVVVTSRPGYGVDFGRTEAASRIRLGPVGGETTELLLGEVLGARSVHADLARVIAATTGGNPFYIEEIGADLLEQGAVSIVGDEARLAETAEVRLPDSVQAVIRARLDRVDGRARGVLFVASVIGRDFGRALLERVVDDSAALDRALDVLKEAGLVQQTRVVPQPMYRFKHSLTQQVTYESLLAHRRRELHRTVGERLEEQGRGEDELDLLAHHFGEAGEWEKAVRYGHDAVQRALSLSEHDEARATLERVDGWAERLPSSTDNDRLRLKVLFTMERLLDSTGDRKAQHDTITRLRDLVAVAGTEEDSIELGMRHGDHLSAAGRYEEAEATLAKALERSRTASLPDMQRKVLRSLGLLSWHQNLGTEAEALRYLEEAVELDRATGDIEAELSTRFNIAYVLKTTGSLDPAFEICERVTELADAHEMPMHGGMGRALMAQIWMARGDHTLARMRFEESTEMLRACHQLQLSAQTLFHLATLHLRAEDQDAALHAYDEAIADARRGKHRGDLARALRFKAEVLDGSGRGTEAIPLLEEVQPLLVVLQDSIGQARVAAELAGLYDREGRYREAVAAWGTARQLARQLGDDELEVRALEGLAAATRRDLGQADVAVPLYEEAVEKARSRSDGRVAARLLNSLGVIAFERGDLAEARRYYEAALEELDGRDGAEGTALILASLGAVHEKLGNLEEAESALERALEVSNAPSDRRVRGYALALLGDARRKRDQWDLAEAAYGESLAIRQEAGDRRGEGWMLLKLSEVEERRGALDRVRDLSGRAYEIATEVGDEELRQACTAKERY
jgi:serine/threonine protein kinase/tetratricopeptide (TPR) repeat protein